MQPTVIFALMAIAWVVFLALERNLLRRHQESIPVRIAVTGTRGKTTVVRLLAAVLTEDGKRVLAKTTGSEATYLLPDGEEAEIHRRGPPSIIEQKRLMRRGARLGVDAVVAEVMAVHPECHRVEIGELLRPHLVLATNFRVDHPEAQGSTRASVAATLALDVPAGVKALVPEGELEPAFVQGVEATGGTVVVVPSSRGSGEEADREGEGVLDFAPNLDLVRAAARSLGIEEDAIRRGIRRARGDLGELRVWRYSRPSWLVVNAFAANDPESTFLVQDRILSMAGASPEECTGLLSLRADRGDRTLLWADALGAGGFDRFGRLFVSGLHARALRRRLRGAGGWEKVRLLPPGRPQAVMDRVTEGDREGLLFGFGNIAGLGESLVRHWEERASSWATEDSHGI